MKTPEDRKPGIPDPADTRGAAYTNRLTSLRARATRSTPGTQIPYAWNVNRYLTGLTLDVGCGIGRNMVNLKTKSIGVDHNATSVEAARNRGLETYTVDEFRSSTYARPDTFDGLLSAHVLEHLTYDDCLSLLNDYLPFVKPGGTVMLICPQEKGYAAETTHIHWVDHTVLSQLGREVGLEQTSSYSFPFPRFAGNFFTHNEFCATFRKT